jgi:integrase
MKLPEPVRVGQALVRIYPKSEGVWTLKWREAGKARATSFTGNIKEAQSRARGIAKRLDGQVGGRLVTSEDAEVLEMAKRVAGERSPIVMLREFERAKQLLRGHSIIEAAQFYARKGPMTCENTTLAEATARFLKGYENGPRFTLAGLRKELSSFADIHGDMKPTELDEATLEEWISRGGPAPRFFNNRLGTWKTFLNRCRDWKYLPQGEKHPAETIKPKRLADKSPEILSVEQCKKLLAALPENLIPYVAVGCFAGVRPFEMLRLKWEDFDWSRSYLHVRAEVAGKTSQERFVPLQSNLVAILKPLSEPNGRFCETHAREKVSLLARAKGILDSWPMDVMRHSFCSYRLAQTQNIGMVAEEAGNSPAIIRKHYRRPLKREDGDAWFAITI